MSGKVWLVGAGPGDPQLLTLKAVRALNQAEIVMIDDLVNPVVLEHCPAAYVVPVGKRGGCRSTPQDFTHRLMLRYRPSGQVCGTPEGRRSVHLRSRLESSCLCESGFIREIRG